MILRIIVSITFSILLACESTHNLRFSDTFLTSNVFYSPLIIVMTTICFKVLFFFIASFIRFEYNFKNTANFTEP